MHCVISEEAKSDLRDLIAKELLDLQNNSEVLDIKKITRIVYDLMLDISEDTGKALDYAHLVPDIINKFAANRSDIADMVIDADINLLPLVRSFAKEDGLKKMEEYLGVNTIPVLNTLVILNENQETETSTIELDTREINKGNTVKVIGQDKSHEVLEDFGVTVMLSNGIYLKSEVELIEVVESKTTATDTVEEVIPEENVSDKMDIQENLQEFIDEPFQEELEIISPVIPQRGLLGNTGVKITKILYDTWHAVAPTFLSDGSQEAPYYKNGEFVGNPEGGFRVPDPDQKFYYGVKRTILQAMSEQNVSDDSTKVTLGMFSGFYLTAMNISQIKIDSAITDMDKDKESLGVALVITTADGFPIQFNENYQPVLEGGKIAYYNMRSLRNYMDSNNNFIPSSINTMAKSLAHINTGLGKSITEKDLGEAKAQIYKELNFIKEVREYLNKGDKTNTVQFKINGGSLGYIETSKYKRTSLKDIKDNNLEFVIATGTMADADSYIKEGTTYVTSPELYNQLIEVERPTVTEAGVADLLLDLMVEDLSHEGKPISYRERRKFLKSYFDVDVPKAKEGERTKKPGPILLSPVPGNDSKYVLIVNNKEINISTSEQKKEARKLIQESIFNLRTADGRFNIYKIHVFAEGLTKNVIDKPVISTNDQGVKTVTGEEVNIKKFLSDLNFSVHTAEVAADGKLRRTNAYFTYELTEQGDADLYDTTEEQIKAVEEKVESVKEIVLTQDGQIELLMSSDEFLDSQLNKLDKGVIQKNQNKKVTEEQKAAAKAWYENHPLRAHIEFEELFHMVNTMNNKSIAEWSLDGIKLFNGSDYTDLYHEAWHGFSQTFMNKDQQKALYSEVRKKSGTFKDYDGNTTSFGLATNKQIEEYLAEQFREYMLNGQKPKTNSPKQNSFFRKIFNILKAIFSDATTREIILDANADVKIKEIFEKLKIGNLQDYKFDRTNASFGNLNQGITTTNTTDNINDQLNYQNSMVITDMIDRFMSEYITSRNAQLTTAQIQRFIALETEIPYLKIGGKDSQGNVITAASYAALKDELKILKDNQTYKFSGEITKNPEFLKKAYIYSLYRIGELHNAHVQQINETLKLIEQYKDATDIPTDVKEKITAQNLIALQKRRDVLKFAYSNFGNTTNLNNNKPKKSGETIRGVIGYHIEKSKVFLDTEVALDFENMSETDMLTKNQKSWSAPGNETSLKEMAKSEILYLLKTLPNVNKKGELVKNEYSVTELAPFNKTWNKLARALQNTQEFTTMYNKLVILGENYPPVKELVKRLGDPILSIGEAEHSLWTSFWKSFNKTRVSLIQMRITKEKKGDNLTYSSRIGEAFNADFAIGKRWQDDFISALPKTVKYINTDDKGNYLDIASIIKDFTPETILNNPIAFYRAIGFDFSDDNQINIELKKDRKKYDPTYFYLRIKELNRDKVRVNNVKQIVDATKTFKGLDSRYKSLQLLEAQYSDIFSSFMVTNAEGNTQFEHSLNNSLTIMVNGINNAKTYDELINQPHLSYLNIDSNPSMKASTILRSVFYLNETDKENGKYGQKRQHQDEDIVIKLTNLSGVLIKEEKSEKSEGISSASADEYTKLILDIHLSYAGYPELMRHADKGTSYSISISGPLGKNKRADDNYIPIEAFKNDDYINLTTKALLPHIIAETKRIKEMKRLAKSDLKNYDFNYVREGQNFMTFDDMLIKSKSILMDLINEGKDIEKELDINLSLREQIDLDIQYYFEKQFEATDRLFQESDFISDSVIKSLINDKGIPKVKAKEALIRSHVHNNWIHNIETMVMFYGDPAMYKHNKEEFHKRNAGAGSTGDIFRTDEIMQQYINGKLYPNSYAAKNAEHLGITDPESIQFKPQLKTAIVEDMAIRSVFYEEYAEQIGKEAAAGYGNPNDENSKAQNEADAQGMITFDGYRNLKVAEGSWSNEQENLYQRIVKNESIKPSTLYKFFPVMKAQYWGPLHLEGLPPVMAFHKYSLFPMIPSVIKDKTMSLLHDRMVKEGITYLTFESGSKIGTITKNGKPDVLFNQGTRTLVSEITDNLSTPLSESNKPYFTPNVIHLQYLKNQLEIHDEYKGQVIFSTQMRKLIEDGLMEVGIPTDFMIGEKNHAKRIEAWEKSGVYKSGKLVDDSKMIAVSNNYKLLKTFENNLGKLTQIAKDKLLAEINWTSKIENGKEVLNGKMEDLLKLVKSELNRQEVGDHILNMLQVNENGDLKTDLSLSLNVEQIEKLLNALMVKRLVKQKVNGEALIQVAVSLMENISSTANRDFKNPTKADRDKYGSNDLPSYHRGEDGKTRAMKVKVSLSKNFIHLLKAKDLDGNIIGDITTLNSMIKNEDWLNTGDHRQMLTMVGVRIPVQGLNSMEFMEVYEFLDPAAGAIIIPPTEIVTKSGADFDVDKMTVMMPNIVTINGEADLIKSDLTTKTKQELLAEKKELRESINIIQKKHDAIFDKQYIFPENEEGVKEKKLLEDLNNNLDKVNNKIKELNEKWSTLSKIKSNNDSYYAMLATEEEIDTLYIEHYNLQETKNLYKDTFNEEFEKEVKPLKDKLGIVVRQINSLSEKAVQNDLISNIKEILELPSNYSALITPNSTSLLDDLAAKAKESMDYNPLNTVDGKRRTAIVKGKSVEVISPTRIFEIGYNLYKHASNNIGKQTLGLGAVDNTYNTLFNRIGAYMNPYSGNKALYEKALLAPEKKENASIINNYLRQTILLSHNTLNVGGDEAISLSHLLDANGQNKISDVVNQLINGWVDVAKDSWIFNIQGNKEVSPVLLFMVQAGVPITDIVHFVSNPLIKEYVKEQKKAKSTFARALNKIGDDSTKFRSEARKAVLMKYGFNVGKGTQFDINKAIKERLEGQVNFNSADLEKRAEKKINSIDQVDKNIFLHYLQLEDMTKSVRDVKMRTNVDTSRDVSLYEATDRLSSLDALESDPKLASSIVRKLKNESPISSFFIQDFQIKLLGDLFPLRNDKTITQYLQDTLSKDEITNTYGQKDKTIINWKSNLVSFVLQNELRYFDISNLTHYHSMGVEEIKEVPLQKIYLEQGAYVHNGKMYVDVINLKEQYYNQVFSSSSYGTTVIVDNKKELIPLAPIPTSAFSGVEEYLHFSLEREFLRSQRPLSSLTESKKLKDKIALLAAHKNESEKNPAIIKMAYEEYLRDEALLNIFNHWALFQSENSYAQEFIRLRKAYPNLGKTFALINALSLRDKLGYKNLALNDSSLDKDQINVLYENLHGGVSSKNDVDNLTNVEMLERLLPDVSKTEIKEIVEFFEKFPVVAFLQSGMNTKSSFALTPFVSQDKIQVLLEQPIKKLKDLLKKNDTSTKSYLDVYHKTFVAKHLMSNRAGRIRGIDMNKNISLIEKNGMKNMGAKTNTVPARKFTPGVIIQEGTIDGMMIVKTVTGASVSSYSTVDLDVTKATELVNNNPDVLFVFNSPLDNQKSRKNNQPFYGLGDGVKGLTTLRTYNVPENNLMEQPTYIRDLNDDIDPVVKEAIDNDIAMLKNSSKILVFSTDGYGQNMIQLNNKKTARFAPKTFVYLSEQLMKNFGYINPGYLKLNAGKFQIESEQPIKSIDIKEMSDKEVQDFINHCN